ncbi:hypothetical protein BJX70DRAFT_390579 [Aspergillus crustosus]
MVVDSSRLLGLLSSIRETEEFLDIKVKYRSSSFQLHYCEAQSRVVTISDDPFITSKMFNYLYRADYDDHPDTPNNQSERDKNKDMGSPEIHARINVQVYIIADKYIIDTLKVVSQKKLEFINIIKDVYGPAFPPRLELCNILACFALQHVSTLQKSQRFHEIQKDYP